MKQLIRKILKEENKKETINRILTDTVNKVGNNNPNFTLDYEILNDKLVKFVLNTKDNTARGTDYEKVSNEIYDLLSKYDKYGGDKLKFNVEIYPNDDLINKFLNTKYIKNYEDKLQKYNINPINYFHDFNGFKNPHLEKEIRRRDDLSSSNIGDEISDFIKSLTDVPLDITHTFDKQAVELVLKIYPKLTYDEFINCRYSKWFTGQNEQSLNTKLDLFVKEKKLFNNINIKNEIIWPREIGNYMVSQNQKVRNELPKSVMKVLSVGVDYGPCAKNPILKVGVLPNTTSNDYRNERYKVIKALEKHFPTVKGINTTRNYWEINKMFQPDDKRYWSKEQLFKYFVDLSKNKFGDLYEYDIDKFVDLDNLTEIYCKQHQRWFEVLPKEHIGGKRCPFDNESKGETMVRVFLEKNNIKFQQYHKLKGCFSTLNGKCILLTFDFYLPELNVTIEYDGEQHYKPIERFGGEKTYERQVILDEIKNQFCEKSNIKLIRIPYTVKKQKDINDILTKELL